MFFMGKLRKEKIRKVKKGGSTVKRLLEEFGIIIVVICLILLLLGFSTGSIRKQVFTNINNVVDHMSGMVSDGKLTLNANEGTIEYEGLEQESLTLSTRLQFDETINNNVSDYSPTRVGYTFKGWYDQSKGGEKVYDADGKCVDGEFWSEGKYQKHSGMIVYAHWQANSYHLDLNGILNGNELPDGNLEGYATCDIYINGEKVADDVNDYWWPMWETGSTYEIKDIKVKEGYSYVGVMNGDKAGSLKGTIIGENVRVDLCIVKNDATFYLDLNGILNGVEISDGTLGNVATCDVYVDGNRVAQNVTDFYRAYKSGTTFEIKNIKVNNGYTYVGVMNGKKEGSLTGKIVDRQVRCDLEFQTK